MNGFASDPGKAGKVWFEWGTSTTFGRASGSLAFTGETTAAIRVCTGTSLKIFYRGVAQSGGSIAYGATATFQ